MQRKSALQTLFFLTAWLVLQNFNVATTNNRPTTDGGKSKYSLSAPHSPANKGYRIKKVVLDAGHGGKDPGCIGASSREKNNTLAIVLKLGELIRENCPDVQVIYTRTTDEFIELKERAAIANRNKADLFISVHCNAISVPSFHGTETYVLGLHRAEDNLEVAKRENAVIMLEDNYQANYGGYDPTSPEAHILSSMWQSAYLEQSILFASMVQQQAVDVAGRMDKGVKQAGFLVLRETAMPAVLIEAGFLTNRTEEQYIASDDGQAQMAEAILGAFLSYRSQMEGTPLQAKKTRSVAAAPPADAPQETAAVRPAQVPKEAVQKPVVKQAPVKTNDDALASNTKIPAKNSGPAPPSKPAVVKTPPAKPVSTSQAVVYRIHLFSWPVRMDMQSGLLGLLGNVEEEKAEGEYRYFTGNYGTRAEAEQMLPELRNLGFRTAEIVSSKSMVNN